MRKIFEMKTERLSEGHNDRLVASVPSKYTLYDFLNIAESITTGFSSKTYKSAQEFIDDVDTDEDGLKEFEPVFERSVLRVDSHGNLEIEFLFEVPFKARSHQIFLYVTLGNLEKMTYKVRDSEDQGY